MGLKLNEISPRATILFCREVFYVFMYQTKTSATLRNVCILALCAVERQIMLLDSKKYCWKNMWRNLFHSAIVNSSEDSSYPTCQLL